MKILVTYSSWTGNTKKVANAIHEQIGGDIMPMSDVKNWENYDFLALGFFVDKGFAGEEAKAFMEKIRGKKVGLFATLGAYPDGEHAFNVMEKGRDLMLKNQNILLCEFICQGAIDPKLIERMRKMALQKGDKAIHPITPEREQRWKDAASHPDENDLNNAKKTFSIIKN